MAITECAQGHLYDPDVYAVCPYCSGGANMINFDQAGRTAAPAGYGSAPNATVAPGAYGGGAPNRTVPIQNDNSAGKTVAPEGYRKKQEEENKTVGVFNKTHNIEPVVGWLACVEGADKGKSYELYAKINTIGRSSENDVCIQGDATISRKNHARLAYDPKHNNFRLIPDDSTNNIYLKEEPIYTPALLNAYDVIEFGQSKLIFVPLCCEHFRWDAGNDEEKA